MSTITNPNWPIDGIKDSRNVCDYYKYWRHEAILADQDTKRTDLVVVAENFGHDFNVSTVIRSSNAFLCAKVVVVGRRRWDRRGACGMHHYEHVEHKDTLSEVIVQHPHHKVVVLDNVPDATNIYDFKWDKKTLLILGQESIGVSPTAMNAANDVVYIPQWGAVRSLNVGSAATVAMAFYRSQW